MATTIINGTTSANGYGFYLNVIVDDTIQSDNTFLVNIDAYIVNNGTRTNTGGWDKQTIIQGIGSQTDTNQTLNTTNVDMHGGVTLAIRHYGIYRVPIGTSQIYVTGAMARNGGYNQYDPGYCEAKGWVQMPRVQSIWGLSLLSIPNIESAFSLSINKYVSSYYNVVEVRNANNTQLIKTINDAVDGTSVTFTSSELSAIYTIDNNVNAYPLVFYMDLKTYTNSSKTTQVGTTQRLKCEAYLVNSNPTISSTLVEQDANVISFLGSSTSSKIIKNASDLLFTITATPQKSATIRSVMVNNDYATLDNGNYVLNLTNITTGDFTIKATDSRGLETTSTITKTPIDYIAVNINSNWTIERTTAVSSDFKLNATIDCFSSTIDGTQNTPTVQYSIDNENWTTISSSSYTFANDKITITNLTIEDLMSYQDYGKFYLKCTDLLSSSQDNKDIAKGIETFSYGESDFQINGDLIIADEDGENGVNALSGIPISIYSGSTTNALSLTLDDDISNYSYVEFLCSLDSSTGHQFTAKGQVGHTILLNASRQGYLDSSYYGIRLNTCYVTISGTSLTKTIGYTVSFKTTGEVVFSDSRNDVYIHKVFGYK